MQEKFTVNSEFEESGFDWKTGIWRGFFLCKLKKKKLGGSKTGYIMPQSE